MLPGTKWKQSDNWENAYIHYTSPVYIFTETDTFYAKLRQIKTSHLYYLFKSLRLKPDNICYVNNCHWYYSRVFKPFTVLNGDAAGPVLVWHLLSLPGRVFSLTTHPPLICYFLDENSVTLDHQRRMQRHWWITTVAHLGVFASSCCAVKF